MSEALNVFSEKLNKIAYSANDDKEIQKPDRVTTYLYVKENLWDAQKRIN